MIKTLDWIVGLSVGLTVAANLVLLGIHLGAPSSENATEIAVPTPVVGAHRRRTWPRGLSPRLDDIEGRLDALECRTCNGDAAYEREVRELLFQNSFGLARIDPMVERLLELHHEACSRTQVPR